MRKSPVLLICHSPIPQTCVLVKALASLWLLRFNLKKILYTFVKASKRA
jgi:hypothetical protein